MQEVHCVFYSSKQFENLFYGNIYAGVGRFVNYTSHTPTDLIQLLEYELVKW